MSSTRDSLIPEIISEFSEVFAFSRARWAQFAEEIHPELRGLGLMVLQTIRRRGPITATEIAHSLMLDKSVVSRQITKLRQIDLILAKPSEEDGRVILLTVTEQTLHAIERLQSLNANAYSTRFQDWTDDELTQLQSLLHRFNASAEEGDEEFAARAAARCSRQASENAAPASVH